MADRLVSVLDVPAVLEVDVPDDGIVLLLDCVLLLYGDVDELDGVVDVVLEDDEVVGLDVVDGWLFFSLAHAEPMLSASVSALVAAANLLSLVIARSPYRLSILSITIEMSL